MHISNKIIKMENPFIGIIEEVKSGKLSVPDVMILAKKVGDQFENHKKNGNSKFLKKWIIDNVIDDISSTINIPRKILEKHITESNISSINDATKLLSNLAIKKIPTEGIALRVIETQFCYIFNEMLEPVDKILTTISEELEKEMDKIIQPVEILFKEEPYLSELNKISSLEEKVKELAENYRKNGYTIDESFEKSSDDVFKDKNMEKEKQCVMFSIDAYINMLKLEGTINYAQNLIRTIRS